MWNDDDIDWMSADKEDREETGRRLSGPLPPPVPMVTPVDEDDDKPTADIDLTLDELADRIAGSLT